MQIVFAFGVAFAVVQQSFASILSRDSVTASVNFGDNTGTPQHLASGIPYGVPDQENQVQNHWYADMGFNYLRAGGAQLPAPARGWIWGLDEYKNRFASALSNYRTARKHGAKFIFLIHDLWGADGTQNSTAAYPGDNGDWKFWDQYFAQLVSDMRSNAMLDGVIIDIWNEPDGHGFWARDQSQFLQYWGRAYAQFRTAFGSTVLLSGPATAGEPSLSNEWWTSWASFVASNGSVPDQYAWHMEGGGGNMIESTQNLARVLAQYSLPSRPININEYAIFNEQVPAGSAWWISQLERVNAHGLRGNWLSGYQLHDFLASLLSKPGAQDSSYSYTSNNYYPNGDYQVYKYYNLNMTGNRVATLPSSDGLLDCYATVGKGKARVMVGVRIRTGTWTLQLNKLSAVGLPASGTLKIHTLGFPASSNAHYGEIDGPVDLGVYGHPYSGDSVSFPIYQTDSTTAYVFDFDIPS